MGQASKWCKVTVTPEVSVEIRKFTSAKETNHLHFACQRLSYKYQVCFLQTDLPHPNSYPSSNRVFLLKAAALGGVLLLRSYLGREGEINHRGNRAQWIEPHSWSTSVKRKA